MTTEWGRAIEAALAANRASGVGPSSLRALYARLEHLSEGSPTAASWKTTIRHYRRSGGRLPGESHARLIAEALGVNRAVLPASGNGSQLAQIKRRLEGLEAKVAGIQTVEEKTLDLLERRVGALERQAGLGSAGHEDPAGHSQAEPVQ